MFYEDKSSNNFKEQGWEEGPVLSVRDVHCTVLYCSLTRRRYLPKCRNRGIKQIRNSVEKGKYPDIQEPIEIYVYG